MPRDVAIIVPCFNEELRLETAAFRRFLGAANGPRLVLVDDGSTDGTGGVLQELAADQTRASVLLLARNSGKAEAVRQGVLAALEDGADVVGYWDADLSTPLDAVPTLAAALDADPELLGVFASRLRILGHTIERRATRHYTGRVFATVASLALGVAVYDTQCGAKLFRALPVVREAFARPFRSRWAFDVELLDRLLPPGTTTDEAGRRIREVPVAVWRDRPGSKLGVGSSLVATAQVATLGLRRRRARR